MCVLNNEGLDTVGHEMCVTETTSSNSKNTKTPGPKPEKPSSIRHRSVEGRGYVTDRELYTNKLTSLYNEGYLEEE